MSRRLQKAYATCSFSIVTEFFSEDLVKLVNAHSNAIGVPPEFILCNAHSNAIGVPPEFILWPLLMTTALLMGTNAAIRINQECKHHLVCHSGEKEGKENCSPKTSTPTY